MTEQACQDRPEGVARGVHHPEMKRGSGHFPVVVEAYIRHDGRPVGDQCNQETGQCIPALITVKERERMKSLQFLLRGFGSNGLDFGGGAHKKWMLLEALYFWMVFLGERLRPF